jgi:hypothetical protein
MRGFCWLLGTLLLSVPAWAGPESPSEWQLETLGYETFASHKALPKLRLPLEPVGAGGPEILSWAPVPRNPRLRLLSYVAGVVGTSELVLVVRGAVVDPEKSRVLADEVIAYRDPENPAKNLGTQPAWSWTEGDLIIQKTDRKQPLRIRLK